MHGNRKRTYVDIYIYIEREGEIEREELTLPELCLQRCESKGFEGSEEECKKKRVAHRRKEQRRKGFRVGS